MSALNRATIIGNLGRDPEGRTTQSGAKVVTFSVATTEKWSANGEAKERTDWHSIVIWNEALGAVAEKYLRKGSKVFIEGSMQTREYVDKAGLTKKAFEIVLNKFGSTLKLLGDPPGGQNSHAGGAGDHNANYATGPRREDTGRGSRPAGHGAPPAGASSWERGADLDDEIPF